MKCANCGLKMKLIFRGISDSTPITVPEDIPIEERWECPSCHRITCLIKEEKRNKNAVWCYERNV